MFVRSASLVVASAAALTFLAAPASADGWGYGSCHCKGRSASHVRVITGPPVVYSRPFRPMWSIRARPTRSAQ